MKRIVKLSVLIAVLSLGTSVNAQTVRNIAINFAAVVGEKPFSCTETYDSIGTSESKMTISDFRFFVQNVRVVDKKGNETPVKLTSDGSFQTDSVALLDFEKGDGACKNGTSETNTVLRGSVPEGKYVGIRFQIGVPEDLNHADPTKQPSPLNITRMLWSWQAGYKFVRIDTNSTGRPAGYVLHLGSTECKTDAGSGKTTCGHENRPTFEFDRFDPVKDVVTVDLKALFAGVNVDENQEKTASGCMSFEGDSDCKPIFATLGLSFEGSTPGKQTFMRVGKTQDRKNVRAGVK